MRVQVRLFASLVEKVGRSELGIDVDPQETVGDVWTRLTQSYPELGRLGYRPLAACDLSYAGWSDPLQGVKQVAFLPPVSGG